ncbi:hypothetical protein [Aeromicrobium sp. UC242_57]|uniref:hypothetical protein n=1 Tax=Aeromicrobium sp. UC242_57 TaxID=3374624 RepID=UPI003788757C
MRRRRRRGGLELERSGPWIGAVGLLMVLWCSVSTVLFAPWWGVVIALALLVPQVWLVVRWARTHPTWCMWVPVVGVVVWVVYAVAGARLLDWSA